MKTPAALLILSLSLFAAGCGRQAHADEPAAASVVAATVKAPERPAPPAKVLTDPQTLQQAQQSLAARAEFQGKPIRVFEKINFFDGLSPRIELAVQNPQAPDSLVFYTYADGRWQVSEAEDISHLKNLPRHLFDLNLVRFADAALYAQSWQQHAAQVNAVWREPYHVAFVYLPKQNKRFWHTATLEAHGAQYYLSFHENGSVWEFKRIQGGSGGGEE